MSQFVHELERVLLTHRTACLVAQDRFEAHAAASVDGPQFAPANGKRMLAPMTLEQQEHAYRTASRRPTRFFVNGYHAKLAREAEGMIG